MRALTHADILSHLATLRKRQARELTGDAFVAFAAQVDEFLTMLLTDSEACRGMTYKQITAMRSLSMICKR